jgi:dTDP-glucose 4,6-dehydratase
MKYLLSGGAGFVGSHLTDALLDDGHSVTVIDNLSTGTLQNFRPERFNNPQFTIHEADITKPIPADPEFDVVVHLASIPTPGTYMSNPIETLRTGSLGTKRTLDMALESNATYLLTSTSEVYGDPEEHPQQECYNGNVDPFGPRACYDEGKRYAEALTRAYRDTHDLDIRIARIFNTYGPRMRDDRVIPAFISQATAGNNLTIHGDGTQTRSFCYISDLISGLRALIASDVSTPVNIGNPDERSIQELADMIIEQTEPAIDCEYSERPPDDPERRQPDISKAKEQLSWKPTVALRDGLERTIEAHRQ